MNIFCRKCWDRRLREWWRIWKYSLGAFSDENTKDYDDIIYYEEWLLIDISTDDGILQAVNSYSVSPVTLVVKIGEEDAKAQPQQHC